MVYKILFGLFLIYTSVSTVILRTFACSTFDYGANAVFMTGYQVVDDTKVEVLRVDHRIDCNAPDRFVYLTYATIMAIIYPIGVPVFYGYLLWAHRAQLNPAGV